LIGEFDRFGKEKLRRDRDRVADAFVTSAGLAEKRNQAQSDGNQ
jgi:hypothetical protein